MFFDDLSEIEQIARRNGCTILVLPNDTKVELKNAWVLEPEGKATITIEQVRNTLANLTARQTEPRFIVIRPADKLGEEAANAILKNLEEPKENVHFVLILSEPSRLMQTILSRAAIYIWRGNLAPVSEIRTEAKIKDMAKRFLVAGPSDLVGLAEEVTKKKDGVREQALNILGVAIEMAYKSYLLTEKAVFLRKISKFITAYEAISAGGHVKLHLVADLI